ncbi:MAG: hypothetical protein AAFU86_16020 [Pseudomonadota bacterium]
MTDMIDAFRRPGGTLKRMRSIGTLCDVASADQGTCPPEGRWVSCEGTRSDVDDLVHLIGEAAP